MGRGVWWARQRVNECEFLESDGRVIEQAIHSTTEVRHAWHVTNSWSVSSLISRPPGWERQRPVDHMKSFSCCRPKLVTAYPGRPDPAKYWGLLEGREIRTPHLGLCRRKMNNCGRLMSL